MRWKPNISKTDSSPLLSQRLLAVSFYIPRLAWGRVSDHLFRWTQVANMTDSALDRIEGQLDSSGLCDTMSGKEYDVSVWKSIPGFAKIVILFQTIIILFMSFWVHQEYLNNSYLQVYVSGYLQGGAFATIGLISIGGFTTVAMVLFVKLRSTRKELEGILSTETVGVDGSGHGQRLDTRAEQHLIEMIRKTTPIMNSGPKTAGSMPTLRRADSQSPRE